MLWTIIQILIALSLSCFTLILGITLLLMAALFIGLCVKANEDSAQQRFVERCRPRKDKP